MGGAAGHMSHPYDLAWVNTGDDLVRFFELAKDVEGTVKIDGVNVSFKVVGEGDNKQFAVDRGSLKMIDIEGVTIDRVEERFPKEGHGMRRMVPNLLNILNEALPSVKSELEAFGMWDDPSRFLNTEYVEGTTNVTAYDKNFLAIHGLNQFYQKVGKVGKAKGVARPGVERPEGVTDPSVEVPYDDRAMESFVKKINAVAQNYGFEVISEAQVRRMEDANIDFSEALAENLTIRISEDREITKSLREWLSEVTNPRYKLIKGTDGKTYNALHRELYYKLVEEGTPVTKLIDQADAQDAIFGAVMVHAVRTLGNVILRASTSDLGDLTSHEGIVLRNKRKFKTANPVKITGEFILGNLGGGFGGGAPPGNRDDDVIDIEIEDEDEDPVGDAGWARTIAIVPGAFKPPHVGHADMVRKYADMADEVIVLISKPLKSVRSLPDGRVITAEDSLKIWELLVKDIPNVKIGVYNDPAIRSPMSVAYALVGKPGEREIAATKVEPSIEAIAPGDKVILGASTKDDDWKRWRGAEKYVGEDLILLDPATTAVKPLARSGDAAFSATDMRELLGDPLNNTQELEEYIGVGNVPKLLSILGLGEEPLEETSSGAGGAVGGFSGPFGRSTAVKRRKKKKKKNESVDLSIVDEVFKLLNERGIIT
jgi:cytidyltransferase-like protein